MCSRALVTESQRVFMAFVESKTLLSNRGHFGSVEFIHYILCVVFVTFMKPAVQ